MRPDNCPHPDLACIECHGYELCYLTDEDESIDSDTETTQFTCGVCGEKWNLISPKSDIDNCPECGITVYSDKKRSEVEE